MEATLPQSMPPGRIVESYGRSGRLVWMSDGPVPDADDWWRRLYAERARTGLYPVLLEYCEDFSGFDVGGDDPVDAAAYLRDLWRPGSWPSFPEWPGLAAPAAAGLDPGACAAEVATGVVRENWARCLALVEVERGADAPAALHWPGTDDALTALPAKRSAGSAVDGLFFVRGAVAAGRAVPRAPSGRCRTAADFTRPA